MSLKFLNEGFELSQFNVLQESVVNQITSILNTLNEATMSDDDRRDNELLRQILSKASDASYDRRRSLKWTPQELDIADKYNLTLPQRTTKWDGSKEITPLKDNDVDYERGFGRNRQVRNLEMELSQQRRKRAQQFVDNSQAEQDAKINKLKSEYERRIDSLKKYYDDANQNSKSKIDRANNEIDALLKRGET